MEFNEMIQLLISALLVGRKDLAKTLIHALHIEISLNQEKSARERYELHLHMSAKINEALRASGQEIVLGIFPKGTCLEESLFDDEQWNIGWGPAKLEVRISPVEFFRKERGSYRDSYGTSIRTVFFFAGSDEVPAGVYYRRQSGSGRTDYVLHLSAGNTVKVVPQSVLENQAFAAALDEIVQLEIDNHDAIAADEETKPVPNPWQQWETWVTAALPEVNEAIDLQDEDGDDQVLGLALIRGLKAEASKNEPALGATTLPRVTSPFSDEGDEPDIEVGLKPLFGGRVD